MTIQCLEPLCLKMEPTVYSSVLWMATLCLGMAGAIYGFFSLQDDVDPNLDVASYLAIFACGLLSFVRHSIFYRSDEVRIGWTTAEIMAKAAAKKEGETADEEAVSTLPSAIGAAEDRYVNYFLIEVGFANFAWGVVGLLAPALNWGLRVEAALFLVCGLYFAMVALMMVVLVMTGNSARGPMSLFFMISWAAVNVVLGSLGMAKANELGLN
jgi:hypothetical protein